MDSFYILALLGLLTVQAQGKALPAPIENSVSWTYVGCYKDARPRDLTSSHKDTSTTRMTVTRCYNFCTGFSNTYMALQSGGECRCDNNYGRYGKVNEGQCNTPCTGNKTQTCGGDFTNAVYKIRGEAATRITTNMMTLKTTQPKLVFTALGDWGYDGVNQVQVAKTLGIWSEKNNAAFTTSLGDNFYNNGVTGVDDPRWKTTWKNVYTHKALQRPWVVIEGNHDYYDGNAPNQVKYGKIDGRWLMPSLYYSMHYTVGTKDVHFIFLDTDPIRNGEEFHQLNWFKKELESSTSDWILVFGHHPVASSGAHGSASSTASMYYDYRSIMIKNKVALYICGHDHFLEHLVDSTGVTDYIISGSGAKLREKEPVATANLAQKKIPSKFFLSNYGFVGLELEGDTIKAKYIDLYGKEVYSFTKVNPRSIKTNVVGK